MRKLGSFTVVVALCVVLLMLSQSMVFAQGGGGGGGRRAGAGARGNMDPAAMAQARVDATLQTLALSADEAKVLTPLLTDVVKAQQSPLLAAGRGGARAGRAGRAGAAGGAGGAGAAGGAGGAAAGAGGAGGTGRAARGGAAAQPAELTALRTAVDNASTSTDELKAKMAALRDARTKANTTLQTARDSLRKAVTTRQEAQLVLSGILD